MSRPGPQSLTSLHLSANHLLSEIFRPILVIISAEQSLLRSVIKLGKLGRFLLLVCPVLSSRVSPGIRVYFKAHHQVISSESLIQAGGPSIAPGFTSEMLWAIGMYSVLVWISIQLSQLHNMKHMIRLLMTTFTGKASLGAV